MAYGRFLQKKTLKTGSMCLLVLFVVTYVMTEYWVIVVAPMRNDVLKRKYILGNDGQPLWSADKNQNNIFRPNCENSNNSSGKVHVLLNAYMRSGSFFTGKLLSYLPDTFSYMEPLWKLSLFHYFTTDNQICDTRRLSCRQAKEIIAELADVQNFVKSTEATERPLQTAYRILHDIYSCQLDDIRGLINAQILYGPRQKKQAWMNYKTCHHTSVQTCFTEFKMNCTASKVRVTKIVRMSLAATRPLLEECSNLKVLQLVRDPRGTICSRLVKTKWYPLDAESDNYTARIHENARTLCRRMNDDFHAGKKLMELFPDRVRFIRYDDLVYTSRQYAWDNVTSFLGLERMNLRGKFRDEPYDWRVLLDHAVVDIIDKECSFLYKAFGYVQLRREDIGNTSLLSFIPNFNLVINS